MAGRHGVPENSRRQHSREQRSERRQRVRRRDAAQPWVLWLTVRIVLAVIVVGAVAWSAWLLTQHRGEYWPWVAVVAGSLSLLLIALDVRSHLRERKRLKARMAAVAQEGAPALPPEPVGPAAFVPPPAPDASSDIHPHVPTDVDRYVPPAVHPPVELDVAQDGAPVVAPPPAPVPATTMALELEPAEPELPPEYRGRHSHRA